MHPGRLIYALLVAGITVLAGIVGAVALGVLPTTLDGDPADLPGEPALDSFTSTDGTCVETPSLDPTTERRTEGDETVIVLSVNATLPATNYVLDSPTFERTGPTDYALNVTSSESDEKPPDDCDGVAQTRYTATVRVPHADGDPFTLVVHHGGEIVHEVGRDDGGSWAVSHASDADDGGNATA